MEYFLSQLLRSPESTLFSFTDVVMAMTVTTALCFMLTYVYRTTHRGASYSQSFMITLFLMAVTTGIVMMIIGSNIARAFSLVGALSIIRFRTAMKDPRDTGYLFAAIIVGMGCGTQFYMPAIALTVFLSALLLGVHYFNYGIKERLESIMRVTFEDDDVTQDKIEEELKKAFAEFKRINRISDFGDDQVTNVYIVRPVRHTSFPDLEARLKAFDGLVRLAFYETDQHSPV